MFNQLTHWFRDSLRKGRGGLILIAAGFYMAVSTATRLTLLILARHEIGFAPGGVAAALLVGSLLDVWIAFGVTLPLAAISALLPDRWVRARIMKVCLGALLVGGFFGILYLGVVETFFFDEFNSRFNYVAVDYLIYPHEVFVNIWDSYPVPQFLAATFAGALAAFLLLRRRIWSGFGSTTTIRGRGLQFLAQSAIVVMGALALNINVARISDNRVLNEITANGIHSFVYAAVTNELDYDAYYAMLPESEAQTRLRSLVSTHDATFIGQDSCAIARHIEDPAPERRLSVVVILEESFGSAFVGSLHPDGADCTPYFDTLASDGLLFSHIYATGNRTVRGIEASLAGFPPIPGQSVVKRPGGKGLFTLPAVLRAKGYNTVFLYGGRSYFDNLGDFATHNGFDRVIDQTDFHRNTFSTIWGVIGSIYVLSAISGSVIIVAGLLLTRTTL